VFLAFLIDTTTLFLPVLLVPSPPQSPPCSRAVPNAPQCVFLLIRRHRSSPFPGSSKKILRGPFSHPAPPFSSDCCLFTFPLSNLVRLYLISSKVTRDFFFQPSHQPFSPAASWLLSQMGPLTFCYGSNFQYGFSPSLYSPPPWSAVFSSWFNGFSKPDCSLP